MINVEDEQREREEEGLVWRVCGADEEYVGMAQRNVGEVSLSLRLSGVDGLGSEDMVDDALDSETDA